MRSFLMITFVLSVAACGAGGDAGSGGGGGGHPTPDAGAGGVSFGGAQDIGEFRGILDRGEIPGPTTLDANGFFNEHYNAPPELTCSGTLCLSPGLSVGKDWITGKYQAALQLSVNTNVDPTQYQRLPMNLVVVVDHSGSMSADQRLEKVKTGLHSLIDNVRAEDRLAIISFDDVVTIDAPFTATLDRTRLHQVVNGLQPRGGTNIHDGLRAGFNMLGENPPNERQNRVIFLSDGLATVGITTQSTIISMATSFISRGIGLTTIGVGNDFDVLLMRGLAERGAGNFYYVENAAAATEVFTEELAYFMSPLAMDIKIEARTPATWEMKSVIGSTLWTAGPRVGSMEVPAVFLASRVTQGPNPDTGGRRGGGSMIFIQLEPHTSSAGKVADLTLSYRQPGSTERITQTLTLDYDRDPSEMLETPYLSYPEMAERYAMYNMFLGFRLATDYATTDWNCAGAVLGAVRRSASTWGEIYTSDEDIAADLVLLDKFVTNLRAKGANTETALASCPRSGEPYPQPPYGDDYPGDDTEYHGRACAAGGGNTSWLALLGVALLVVRRRRR
ncbi:MAG: VWA domain-containing protein [Deltaproteobacteria bacterium]|nr:VWA domain-containing protein [Deltaproteobacteria bacterium]MDQ3296217.1 VWA domain-containing protein [Myxococcota bacterium]